MVAEVDQFVSVCEKSPDVDNTEGANMSDHLVLRERNFFGATFTFWAVGQASCTLLPIVEKSN